jgi:hypothetical protein
MISHLEIDLVVSELRITQLAAEFAPTCRHHRI